jgi:hypothetical protein
MNIPDVPPDISFDRLPHTPEASDFAFEVKRVAIGPHIMGLAQDLFLIER